MAQDTNLRGLACDHACLEIQVAGLPVPEAFSSIEPKCSREFEKLWLNGSSSARQRSQGKLDTSMDAEMPAAQFWSMVNNRLGGQGDDPNEPAFMFTEFNVLLAFRPKNQPYTFQMNFKSVTIKEWSLSSAQGKSAMAKLSLDALGLEVKPPQ